jgi:hypothetical protein
MRRQGSSDRSAHGLTALVVGLTLLGSLGVTQAIARPAPPAGGSGPASHGDFAGRVDIGGRSLYMECHGTGRPTVILEAGLRSRGDFWSVAQDPATDPATVLDGVAQFTRVCEYDRPGTTLGVAELSRSDPVPMPRTARQATAVRSTRLPGDVRARLADRPGRARRAASACPARVRSAQRALRDARSAATGVIREIRRVVDAAAAR